MPKVRKIVYNGSKMDINVPPEELVNANNPSEISGDKFAVKDKAPTANALRVLMNYVKSAIIPVGALTFDQTPTLNSKNPVTSDGIARYINEAVSRFFEEKFINITEEEYDYLYERGLIDDNKYYMIIESEYTPDDT